MTRFYYNDYHLITSVSEYILNSVDKILSFPFQTHEWYNKKLYMVLIWYKKSFDLLSLMKKSYLNSAFYD